ncbi:MAG: Uma2 family endonuclease [Aggregatilineales bacterium]
MVAPIQRYSVADFDEFIALPENDDKLFEYIGGEIVDVPHKPHSSKIALLIAFFIRLHMRENNIDGCLTNKASGYKVMGERYAPDVTYIAGAKQHGMPYRREYNDNPPDLAVEVVSPGDNPRQLRIKIVNYLAAGTVVWVIYPETRDVEIYTSDTAVQIFTIDDIVSGGTVLPGLEIAVKEIFPQYMINPR